MVLFVNVLVQRTPVQGAMCPVVESVFKDKEEPDLPSHSQPGGEGYGVCGHLEVFTDRVEAPNLRKLDGEVGKQNVPRALPLQLWCRNTVLLELVLAHRRHRVDDDKGNGSAKVDDLVQQEAHHTRGNDWVAPPQVPIHPSLLKEIERRRIGAGI